MSDSGMAAHLVGASDLNGLSHSTAFGALVENFVATELIKQISWSERGPTLHHVRLHMQQEVEFIWRMREDVSSASR